MLWAIYDISDNKRRSKIAKLCKKYGLYRVQLSVFLGTIESNEFDELFLASQEVIDEKNDSVYLFPMTKQSFKQVRTLGKAFDKKLVSDQVKQLFI